MRSFFLVLFGFLLFSPVASATRQQTFGMCGQNGYSGRDGMPGYQGRDLTLYAEGQQGSYNLSGSDGGPAENGRRGGDAYSCMQPHGVHTDLMGACGGPGGSGGDGGNGGNAGELTVYFDEINNLRSILVRAIPGRGGWAGYGGQGGYPCHCSVPCWTVVEGGTTKMYHCMDGHPGNSGMQGRTGTSGWYGKVTLIPQMTPLLPVTPALTVAMENMLNGPFELSDNVWDSKTGARSLFAPGSDLNNHYQLFRERVEILYGFDWKASRPLTDFAGQKMHLTLRNGSAQLEYPSNIWVVGQEISDSPGKKVFVFEGALYAQEALKLALSDAGGSGKSMWVEVVDLQGVSQLVKTSFSIEYYTKAALIYRLRYQGKIGADNIALDGNHFRISLGQLPIESQYLASGQKALIRLSVHRSYGNHSGQLSLEKYYNVP
ncbi:MAG: hypothetical protein HY537_11880 [Deltaproteobacteria bacterium]|nr:hypothetical protein [Deltaproteobacteria bacterium]